MSKNKKTPKVGFERVKKFDCTVRNGHTQISTKHLQQLVSQSVHEVKIILLSCRNEFF